MEDELLRTDDEHGNDGENNDLHQREAGPQPQRPMGGGGKMLRMTWETMMVRCQVEITMPRGGEMMRMT